MNWGWVSMFSTLQRQIGGWTWGKAVPSSREHPASLVPVWRACGMWCLSQAAGTGPRSQAAPQQSPVWYEISASARAAWLGPIPTSHPPLHTTAPQLPAKLLRHPRANVSVALCLSLMNSVGSVHLGGPKAPGCGQRWKNEGATVEEVSEEEGVSPVANFLPCSVALASVCPRVPAYLQMDPLTCHSSTSDCLSTLNSLALQSPLSLPPRITTSPTITSSSGLSPFPMSR